MKKLKKTDADSRQRSSATIETLFADAITRVKAQAAQAITEQRANSEAQAQQAIAKIKLDSEIAIANEKTKAKEAAGQIIKVKAEAEENAKALVEQVAQLKSELTKKQKNHAEQIASIKAETEKSIANIEAEYEQQLAKAKTEAEETITQIKTEAEAKEKDHNKEITKIRNENEEKIKDLTEQIAKAKTDGEETIAKIKAEHEKQINKIKAESDETQKAHAAEIDNVNTEKEEASAKIKADYEEQIAKAKAEIEEKVQELKRTAKEKVEEKIGIEAKGQARADDTDASASDSAIEEKSVVPAENNESAPGEVAKAIQEMVGASAALPNKQSITSSRLCARDIMRKEFIWASSEDSVQQTLTKMQQSDTGYILIGQNGVPEGIVSKSDLTGAVSPYLRPEFTKWRRPLDDATLQIKVKWIMNKSTHTISPQTPLADIIKSMCQFNLHALPVIDEQGKVQGLVTEVNIFKAILKLMNDRDLSTAPKIHQEQPESERSADSKSTQPAAETM